MYLAQQQTGVLQLTGQLTIHMTSPPTTQFQGLQQPQQCSPSYSQTARLPKWGKPEEEPLHEARSDLQSRSSEAQNLRSPSLTQSHPEHLQRLQDSVASLEERMRRVELSSENVQRVNEQTLWTFQHLHSQLINKLNSHDESFLQRIGNLAEIEKKWVTESEQRMKEAEVKLEKRRQELENAMEQKMNQLLEEERVQAEQVNRHKFEQLARELEKQKTQTCEQMKKLEQRWEQKLKAGMKKVAEAEQKAKKDLEERLSLRISKEAEVVEVLSNKISELKEKSEEQETNERRRREEVEEKERAWEKKKQEGQKLFDTKTPCAHLFLAQGNNITYEGNDGSWRQALLDVVVERGRTFVFHAQITNTKSGEIMIGVVDRHAQRQRQSSWDSGNAVCYYGDGRIFYGDKGKSSRTQTGIKLRTGMEVEVEVDLNKGTVDFILLKGSSAWEYERRAWRQRSDILTPHREFVPYFEVYNKKDSMKWGLK